MGLCSSDRNRSATCVVREAPSGLRTASHGSAATSAGTAQIPRAQRQPASPAARAIGAADTEATAPPTDIAVL